MSDDRIEQDERLNGDDDRPDLRVDPMADGLDGATDGAEGVEKGGGRRERNKSVEERSGKANGKGEWEREAERG